MHKPFESIEDARRAAEAIGLTIVTYQSFYHVNAPPDSVVLNPEGVAVAEIIGMPEGGLVFEWEDLRGK